jgi:hypothetical protein
MPDSDPQDLLLRCWLICSPSPSEMTSSERGGASRRVALTLSPQPPNKVSNLTMPTPEPGVVGGVIEPFSALPFNRN